MRAGVLAAVLIAVCLQPAYAHSPADITMSYNAAREELTVVVSHQVGNPRSHYIETIALFRDGVEVKEETYMSQENAQSQTAVFRLADVKPGEDISVEASCNRGGSMRKSMEDKE